MGQNDMTVIDLFIGGQTPQQCSCHGTRGGISDLAQATGQNKSAAIFCHGLQQGSTSPTQSLSGMSSFHGIGARGRFISSVTTARSFVVYNIEWMEPLAAEVKKEPDDE
jgi:hypothetical protein